jgi:hypothetical protein
VLVTTRLVSSLNRPGAKVTGVTLLWRSRRPGRPKIGTRRRRPDPPTGHHARDRRADLESCTAGGRHLTERQVRDALACLRVGGNLDAPEVKGAIVAQDHGDGS